MRLDDTYFEGFLNIPNTNKAETEAFLNSEIERLEPMFFKSVFGYEFQKEMLENETEPRFEFILSGTEFTDSEDKLQELEPINKALSKYVYFYFVTDNAEVLTSMGYTVANNENSNRIKPITKPVNVFNKMVDELTVLESYFNANESLYEDDNLEFNNFGKENSYGI